MYKEEVDISLNVPTPEEGSQGMFSFGGRLDEITERQHKFFRFVKFLRSHFNQLFNKLLMYESVYSGLMSEKDFKIIINRMRYRYTNDSIYEEAKRRQKLETALELLSNYEEYLLKYYDEDFIRTVILRQTKEDQIKYKKFAKSRKDSGEDESGGRKW